MASQAQTTKRKDVTNTVETSTDRLSNDLSKDRDRRFKATLVVVLVWGIVSLLHWQPQTQWFVAGLTAVLSIQTARMLMAKPTSPTIEGEVDLPKVSILIPAKNESALLTDLVHHLFFHLNYPTTDLEIWIIDDGSTDRTPEILGRLP